MTTPSETEKPVFTHDETNQDTEVIEKGKISMNYDDVGRELFERALTYDTTQLEQDAKKVKKKLYFIVLPIMMITYMLGFLDKSTLNYANVYGLQKDLKMSQSDFDWVASSVSIGWLISAYPASLLLQRISISRLIGFLLITWGAFCMLAAATSNFGGLFALRFLLGAAEAPISPGMMMLTSSMWTSEEAPFITSMWLAIDGVAVIIGSLLSWGLGHAHSDTMPSWKFVFLVVGAITMAWSVVVLLYLPDGPHKGRLFSEYERTVLVWRVSKDRRGVKSPKFKFDQFKEAFIDPKTWLICLATAALGVLHGGVVNFKSALIVGFGFTGLQANLLGMPSGVVQIVGCSAFGLLARKKNWKAAAVILSCLPGVAGLIGLITISEEPRYKYGLVACAWLQSCIAAPVGISWTLPVVNVSGHTKRSAVLGLVFIFFAAGMIGGPHLFLTEEAMRYPTAIIGMLACYVVAIVLQVIYTALCYFQNKNRDQKYGQVLESQADEAARSGFDDLTDMDNKYFRFAL